MVLGLYTFFIFQEYLQYSRTWSLAVEEAASNINIEWEDIAPRGELIGVEKELKDSFHSTLEHILSLNLGMNKIQENNVSIRYDADELFQREGHGLQKLLSISKERWQITHFQKI